MNTHHPIFALLTNTSSTGLKLQSLSAEVYRCPTLQTFTVQGADATTFLQGQLTQDIAQQTPAQAQFAGYCTAQGRVLATMVLIRDDQSQPQFRCFTHASVAQALIKRLRMFVMRSKVVITEAADMTELQMSDPLTAAPLCVVGVSTSDVTALEGALKHILPQQPWHQQKHATGTWVCAPSAAGQPLRWWWLANQHHQNAIGAIEGLASHIVMALSECANTVAHQTTPDADEAVNANQEALNTQDADITTWQQFDIQAGLPWVEQATQDLFIAQTLNLDLIGAVSFTKGCYPGQEVVARAHYRGTLKRRMYLGHIDQSINLGLASDVLSAMNPNEPCGRIISCVAGRNRTDMLFESIIAAATDYALYLPALNAGQDHVKVVIDALPYSTYQLTA